MATTFLIWQLSAMVKLRPTYEGPISFDSNGFPLNPRGRTGLRGRGLLGLWGPNHTTDPIVTRFHPQTNQLQAVIMPYNTPCRRRCCCCCRSPLPLLLHRCCRSEQLLLSQVVVQERTDMRDVWALPGGFVTTPPDAAGDSWEAWKLPHGQVHSAECSNVDGLTVLLTPPPTFFNTMTFECA